jgi:hypothetical protein
MQEDSSWVVEALLRVVIVVVASCAERCWRVTAWDLGRSAQTDVGASTPWRQMLYEVEEYLYR